MACIGVASAPATAQPDGSATDSELETAWRGALREAQSAAERGASLPGVTTQRGPGILKDLLAAWSDRVRIGLASTSDPRLAAMQDYIDRNFPAVPEATWKTGDGRACVPMPQSKSFISKIQELIERLSAVDRLAVDLRVTSVPEGASVSLATLRTSPARTTATNASLTNVYRGYYRYTVSKNGFKTISGDLNLVDERGTLLRCAMTPAADAGAPVFCSLHTGP